MRLGDPPRDPQPTLRRLRRRPRVSRPRQTPQQPMLPWGPPQRLAAGFGFPWPKDPVHRAAMPTRQAGAPDPRAVPSAAAGLLRTWPTLDLSSSGQEIPW